MTTDPNGLTDAAKKELQAAIRIVRADKLETFFRARFPEKTVQDDKKEEKDALPPDTPKSEEVKDEPPAARKSAYWGELFNE